MFQPPPRSGDQSCAKNGIVARKCFSSIISSPLSAAISPESAAGPAAGAAQAETARTIAISAIRTIHNLGILRVDFIYVSSLKVLIYEK